jgi:hypothetical protein
MVAAFIQATYVQAPGATSVVVSPDTAWTTGNLLVAVATARGTGNPLTTPGGWTDVPDDFATDTFDGGTSRMCYHVVQPGDATFTWTKGFTGSAGVVVGEWSGVGAFVDHATASAVAASATLTAGPLAVPSGGHVTIAAFIQATRDGGVAGGLPLDYDWDVDYTEITTEADEGIDHSGPAHTVAFKVHTAASPTESVTCTAADSDTYGWMLAAFEVIAPPTGVYADWDEDGFTAGGTPDDLGQDVISWRITRGATPEITGAATIGQASIILRNRDDVYNPNNTAGTLYSKLTDGVAVWIGVDDDGMLSGTASRNGLFAGRIKDITPIPVPGAVKPPTVEFTCEDDLARLSRVEVNVADSRTRSHNDLRTAILADADVATTELPPEISTMPLSSAHDKALRVLEELNGATGTRHYIEPADSADDWYTYVARDRHWGLSGTASASVGTVDHAQVPSGWRLSADTVINQQRVSYIPVTFTPNTVTVWEPDQDAVPFRVHSAAARELWVDFDDFVDSPTVDMAYSGSTVTATLTSFGDTARIALTSAGTSTVTALTVEGSLARRAPTESYLANGTASQAGARGVRSGGDITSDFVGTLASARGLAEHVVWRFSNPQVRPTLTVTNWMPEQFQVDLFDVISFTSPQIMGTATRLFEVVGLTHEGIRAADDSVEHRTTYVLQESRIQSAYVWFQTDHASSILAGGTVAGSGVLGY